MLISENFLVAPHRHHCEVGRVVSVKVVRGAASNFLLGLLCPTSVVTLPIELDVDLAFGLLEEAALEQLFVEVK